MGGPAANQKRHTPQKTSGRLTLTCALGLTPTWKAKALVMTRSANVLTVNLVKEYLGEHVILIVNETGNVYGRSHVDDVLKGYVGPEVLRMKQALALPPDAPWFYCEDHAPGHGCFTFHCLSLVDCGLCFVTSNF